MVGMLCEGRAIQKQANWFISFISFSKPDKPKKPNKPDEPIEPDSRPAPQAGSLTPFSSAEMQHGRFPFSFSLLLYSFIGVGQLMLLQLRPSDEARLRACVAGALVQRGCPAVPLPFSFPPPVEGGRQMGSQLRALRDHCFIVGSQRARRTLCLLFFSPSTSPLSY